MKRLLRAISRRVQADYLLHDRASEYAELLGEARQRGYELVSLRQFWNVRAASSRGRWLLLRHDIDSSPHNAVRFAEIERHAGGTATYYFRLNRFPEQAILQRLAEAGHEVGYHFEEAASHAKRVGIDRPEALLEQGQVVSELLRTNLAAIRNWTQMPIDSVAAHGDFMNRRLGVSNKDFLPRTLYGALEVRFEAYDIVEQCDVYISDAPYPRLWKEESCIEAIQSGARVIYLTTHPRCWFPDVRGNTRETVLGLWERLRFQLLVTCTRAQQGRRTRA